jgi:hypothetical protein
VLGPGDDAFVVPRGTVRVGVSTELTRFNERYGGETSDGTGSTVVPLAADFNIPPLGVAQIPTLAPAQSALRSLSGIPTFQLSLGQSRITMDASVATTPVTAEIGLTGWLSIGAVVPIVLTRTEVTTQMDPAATSANVGLNPAASSDAARATNAALKAQFDQAAAALTAALAACEADPAGPNCEALNASRDQALALIAGANEFATGVAGFYGTDAGSASPYVPLAASDAQLAVEARLAAFRDQYASFGVVDVITGTGPAPARVGIARGDLQRLLTDAAAGIGADSLYSFDRGSLGDVEVMAKLKLFDTFARGGRPRETATGFNARAAITGVVRFGTGQPDHPNVFVDVATGDGQNDIEVRSALDLGFGRHFWTSLVGRAGFQQADKPEVRIPSTVGEPFPPLYSLQVVDRKLGNYYRLDASPRFMLNDYFAMGGLYSFRKKDRDEYTGTFSLDSATTGVGPVTLDAATLGLGTEQIEHRIGAGFVYSTLAAVRRSRARLPLEISYSHLQTVSGSGRTQYKFFTDQVQVRVYTRLFGRAR